MNQAQLLNIFEFKARTSSSKQKKIIWKTYFRPWNKSLDGFNHENTVQWTKFVAHVWYQTSGANKLNKLKTKMGGSPKFNSDHQRVEKC